MDKEDGIPDKAKPDDPRFRRAEKRRSVALAKYYGTGSDGEWSIEEIAEYLRVSEATVRDYIWNSNMGERMREMFPAAEARMKMDILMEKKERLDELRKLFREKLNEKSVSVTGFTLENVPVEPEFEEIEGAAQVRGDDPAKTIRLDAPSPNQFQERTKFDNELQAILKEIRNHEDDIREMLSLDEPDVTETKHTGDAVVEQKIYEFSGSGDGLPDAQVVDVEGQEIDEDTIE